MPSNIKCKIRFDGHELNLEYDNLECDKIEEYIEHLHLYRHELENWSSDQTTSQFVSQLVTLYNASLIDCNVEGLA